MTAHEAQLQLPRQARRCCSKTCEVWDALGIFSGECKAEER